MKEYPGINDIELIKLVKEGEMPALTALILRYEKQVVKTVTGMLGKCREVDDISQETFIRFYQSLHNFKCQSGVGTYITRIAINLSLNEIKKRKKKNFLFSKNDDDNILQIPDTNLSQHLEKNDLKEIVNKAVQLLEPKYRSVIVLKLIDGYSTKEVTEILEIKKSSVLTRLSRAQEKLRVKLETFLEE
ncbi:MAG: RNA polymerase sigma factor [Bacteroidetes bacterium]|nr:RNA polymerase sigma factor [Bacteroidota bacterium]MBL7104748.1 RNA polymerase sigma factor [Bacteroidales bacterium]